MDDMDLSRQPLPPMAPSAEGAGDLVAEKPSLLDDPSELIRASLPWAISLVLHIVLFLGMMAVVVFTHVTATEELLPVSQAQIEDMVREKAALQPLDSDLKIPPNSIPAPWEDFGGGPGGGQLNLLPEDVLGGSGDPTLKGSGEGEIAIIGIGSGSADTVVGNGEAAGGLGTLGLGAGGLGEGPSFFGLGKNEFLARKIVYVVDRSGSMTEEVYFVKEEVKRSIERLHRSQQFHIIFFSGGPPIEAPPQKLVNAITQYKEQAFEFLKTVEAGGSTDPTLAMARAFQLKADLVYFLTDGEFDPQLVEKLRVWNRDKKTRIYTIAFVRRSGEELLRQIARENEGEYRFVSEDELY